MNQATLGRFGDSQLVHMRPDELEALGLLAQATGNQLTTNPETGYPEAWSMPSWVLPAAAIAATVMTGGAAAPVAAGAMGAGTAAAGAGAATAAGAGALGAATAGTAAGAGAAGLGAAGATGTGGMGLLAAGETAGAAGASGAGAGLLGGSQVNLANSALLMNGAANPAVAGTAASTATPSTGLLGTMNAGLKEYAPIVNAAGTGIRAVSGGQPQQPQQAPQLTPPMSGGQSINDVLAARNAAIQGTMAQSEQARMQRKMQRRGY